MEHQAHTVEIHQSGLIEGSAFGIDAESQAHVFGILRNYMYKNKIRAVLREYATNAWDAHIKAGKGNLPIKIVLPTKLSSNLIIRDFGLGLSEEDIFRIYPKYGTSTKRDSNEANGYFGIGCKSAFAYSDTFTVISRFNGLKSTYVALQDEGRGQFNLMHREACDPSDTGIEINIPVHTKDVTEFEREAQYIFQFFYPTPQINCKITLYPVSTCEKLGGSTLPYNSPSSWVAIMGVVAYPLDFTDMRDEISAAGFTNMVKSIGAGVLHFNIGDVDVAASREALSYTLKTKRAIVGKLERLTATSMDEACAFFADATKTPWEKRTFLRKFYARTCLNVLDEHKPYLRDQPLWSLVDGDGNPDPEAGPKTFRLGIKKGRNFQPVHTILSKTCHGLVIFNTRGTLTDEGHYLVVLPHKKVALEKVRAELDEYLSIALLKGIPITLLSDIPQEDEDAIGKTINAKHKVKRFVWNGGSHNVRSKNWDVVEVMPQADDVFVILSHFEPVGDIDFQVHSHEQLLRYLGVKNFPKIYGVKTTVSEPVHAQDIEGTEYSVWIQQAIAKALSENAEVREMMDAMSWYRMAPHGHKYWMKWADHLSKDHPLILHLQTWDVACDKIRSYQQSHLAEQLWRFLNAKKENPHVEKLEALLNVYPLWAATSRPLDIIYHDRNLLHWVEYIHLIDENNKRKNAS